MKLTNEEFHKLGDSLENYHALFYALFQFSEITFSDKIPTACVQFSEVGEPIQFIFNPEFWEKCTEYDKLFVICHESLHIIFKHGLRVYGLIPDIANVAADIVVNHYLLEKFNFDRHKVSNWENYCWVETVFPSKVVDTDLTFETYYNMLMSEMNPASLPSLIDVHSGFSGKGEESPGDGKAKGGFQLADGDGIDKVDEQTDKLLEDVGSLLTDGDKEYIRDMVNEEGKGSQGGRTAGPGYISTVWNMPTTKEKPKKNWLKIVKKWKKKNKHVFAESEQWARMNRRTALLDENLILPSSMEEDTESDNRINAWLYLDVSGSCYSYKDYFWKAADSIPKKFFDLRMFSFSTRVQEIDMKNRQIYGGGGTSFTCINSHINREVASGKKYPNIVMVITDGWGNHIHPKHPERWHWFLTNYNCTNYIPKASPRYKIKNFARK